MSFNFIPGLSQIPEGGTDILSDPFTNNIKSGKGTLTEVNITDQTFTKAFRYETPLDVVNPWDAQIIFQPQAGIDADDVILVTFYGRTLSSAEETGEGVMNVVIENKSTYAKVLYQNVTMGSEWKQYYAPVKSDVTLEQGNLNCAFFFGFPSQTVEVADIRFLNYKDTKSLEEMPVTEISYIGREPDAPWRSEAQERIEQIRKGDIEITVVDTFGNPLQGAEVSLSMQQHDFGFGSAIVASEYMSNSTYRNKIHELFNEVVFENDLKWTSFLYKSSVQVQQVSDVLDDLQDRNIKMRGHNVIWPSWKFCPVYLQNYENDPERLRLEIDKRIDKISSFTQGRVVDWDVINEPYSEHDIMDILGREVMADWFKRVRNNDPYVKLYLNDYGILSSNGINYVKQDSYIETSQYIDQLGGDVQGIGLQGHFSSNLTPIIRLKTILDKFSVLEKEIKVTEFDIAIDQQEVQADYTHDFLTMMFSHPSVKAVLMWGFWENRHWEPEAALYESDWTIKPNGEAYKKLVFDEWWTRDTTLTTDANGKVYLNGFLGSYSWTVSHEEMENSGTLQIDDPVSSGLVNEFILSVEPGIPASLDINVDGETVFCDGESTELSVDLPVGFTLSWFKGEQELEESLPTLTVDSPGNYHAEAIGKGITLKSEPVSIVVHELPEVNLQVSGDLSFCPGGSVSLSVNTDPTYTYRWLKYGVTFQGSVSEIEVTETGVYQVEVNSNGCRTRSVEIQVTKLAADDAACTVGVHDSEFDFSVFPNPFKDSFRVNLISLSKFPCTIEIIDLKGRIIYQTQLNEKSSTSIFPEIDEGYYLLKVIIGEQVRIQKLVCQE